MPNVTVGGARCLSALPLPIAFRLELAALVAVEVQKALDLALRADPAASGAGGAAEALEPGDVVRFGAHGMRMTVEQINRRTGKALCAWFIGTELKRGEFTVRNLRREGAPPFRGGR